MFGIVFEFLFWKTRNKKCTLCSEVFALLTSAQSVPLEYGSEYLSIELVPLRNVQQFLCFSFWCLESQTKAAFGGIATLFGPRKSAHLDNGVNGLLVLGKENNILQPFNKQSWTPSFGKPSCIYGRWASWGQIGTLIFLKFFPTSGILICLTFSESPHSMHFYFLP